jgi:hypothetical protein
MTQREALWIGAGVLVVLAVLALVLSGGGDDEPEQNATPPAAVPRLARQITVRKVGIRVGRPRGWSTSRDRRGVRLRSADRSTLVAITAPAGARDDARVLKAALRAVRRGYRDVRIISSSTTTVGGRPAASAVVSARNRKGTRLSILAAGAQGRRRAWLVEVFAAAGGSTSRLVEGQVALRSLRLSG